MRASCNCPKGLDAASRSFHIAYQLSLNELRPVIDAQLAGTNFSGQVPPERLGVQTLANYAAAAIMMSVPPLPRGVRGAGL